MQLRKIAFSREGKICWYLTRIHFLKRYLYSDTDFMLADIQVLYESDFYRVVNFTCQCRHCSVTGPEYSESFCMSFIRKGFFEYRVFRHHLEAHVGRILLSKPGFEHTTRHIQDQPDLNTIFEFKWSFFREIAGEETGYGKPFLQNRDIQSVILNSQPAIEYAYRFILNLINTDGCGRLQVDQLVLNMLSKVLRMTGDFTPQAPLPANLLSHHLPTMEKAVEFMNTHFRENISLKQLSSYCFVSPFHFSRMFKQTLGVSPHRYLSGIRLTHAKYLLQSSPRPVTDIAYECGFNSLEHFVTAFRMEFKQSPGLFRKEPGHF